MKVQIYLSLFLCFFYSHTCFSQISNYIKPALLPNALQEPAAYLINSDNVYKQYKLTKAGLVFGPIVTGAGLICIVNGAILEPYSDGSNFRIVGIVGMVSGAIITGISIDRYIKIKRRIIDNSKVVITSHGIGFHYYF